MNIILEGGPDPHDMKVYDADTGKELNGVVEIQMDINPDTALVRVTFKCLAQFKDFRIKVT